MFFYKVSSHQIFKNVDKRKKMFVKVILLIRCCSMGRKSADVKRRFVVKLES